MRQPENDREVVDDVKDEDSQMKSAEAEFISQIPKPKNVACSIDADDKTEVSKTVKASTVLKKHKVALQEEYPMSAGKISEQIR